MATRYDKLAVRYEATVLVAAINDGDRDAFLAVLAPDFVPGHAQSALPAAAGHDRIGLAPGGGGRGHCRGRGRRRG